MSDGSRLRCGVCPKHGDKAEKVTLEDSIGRKYVECAECHREDREKLRAMFGIGCPK